MAPNAAAPIAEPSARANMFVPVTTPRRSQPTTDCTATTSGELDRPMPMPVTNIAAATCQTVVVAGSDAAVSVPATASETPISAVSRKPIRRYSRPACDAAIGQPIVSAPRTSPASIAPVPSTPCTQVGT